MIKKLTKEQEEQMIVYRDKWIKIGYSTESTNKQRALSNVENYYKVVDLKPPETVIFAQSPTQAMTILNVLLSDTFYNSLTAFKDTGIQSDVSSAGTTIDDRIYEAVSKKTNVARNQVVTAINAALSFKKLEYVSNYAGGNLWPGWLSFYDYFDQELKVDKVDIIRPTIALAQDCGWIFPYENLCVLVEKPVELHITNNRMHNEHGMCIKWGDSWGLYQLNGVTVPAWAIETPKEMISAKKVLELTNTEQRTVLMKHVGLAKFLSALNAEVIDTMNDYTLYYLTLEGQKVGPYLRMTCPSSGRVFLEGVGDSDKYATIDPTIETVADALQFRAKKASNNLMKKFSLDWKYRA